MKQAVTLFWFRRDLRLNDNAGLYYALKENKNVLPIFIFDKNILEKLDDKADKRVDFIHRQVLKLQNELNELKSALKIFYDTPENTYKQLLNEYDVKRVYANHDYEPYANERDAGIEKLLSVNGIKLLTYKDHVIFEKNEVMKDDGTPYGVFTPYSKKWKSLLNSFYLKPYPTEKYFSSLLKTNSQENLTLNEIGFVKTNLAIPDIKPNSEIIKTYDQTRNYPALAGTSKLSVHLRFGTISIRHLATHAKKSNEIFLNELIWREFYMMILWHFPHVVNSAYKPAYDKIRWNNNEKDFNAWCEGKTGYPIVDAGMRELNATGYMHNRVRMITASFLIKHLLIDWRWGELYFAKKLMDFDLAANNGGWQWTAGSGCDGAPYFRIFNPAEQTKKFDSDLKYIRKWVPEFEELTYPKPIVDHKFARERCLSAFKTALAEK